MLLVPYTVHSTSASTVDLSTSGWLAYFHGTLVNYTSVTHSANGSVATFPLSYYEFLPPGYNSSMEYPLAIYLHGQQSTTPGSVAGGIMTDMVQDFNVTGAIGKTARAIVNATTVNGMILIAPNTRTGSGWYIDSPCGGPQQQDLQNAIADEQARRNISGMYLFGMSMGTEGTLYTAATHPGMFAGIGIIAPLTDLYEDMYYRQTIVDNATTNLTQPWAYASLQAKAQLVCSSWPAVLTSPQWPALQAEMTAMSPLRFNVSNFSGLPIYATAGGADDRAPNNLAIWPAWLNVNDTFINRTCNRVAAWGEPKVCSVPLWNQHLRNSTLWSFRYVYEKNAGHDLSQLDPWDMVQFWQSKVTGGFYLGPEFPASTWSPTAIHVNGHFKYN